MEERGLAPPHWGLTVPRPSLPGLLWQLRPSDVEVELLAHTRRVVSHDLEEETGLHTGWIQNGGLFIASNRQRLDEYKRLMSVGVLCRCGGLKSWGCPPAAGLGLLLVGAIPAGGGRGSMAQGRGPDRAGFRPWCCPCCLGHLGQVKSPL